MYGPQRVVPSATGVREVGVREVGVREVGAGARLLVVAEGIVLADDLRDPEPGDGDETVVLAPGDVVDVVRDRCVTAAGHPPEPDDAVARASPTTAPPWPAGSHGDSQPLPKRPANSIAGAPGPH